MPEWDAESDGTRGHGTAVDLVVERQAGSIGALVFGVDLPSTPSADEERATTTVAALRGALLDHLVICIRGQSALDSDGQLDFARRWGNVLVHPYVPSIEGHPGLMSIYNTNPSPRRGTPTPRTSRTPPAMTMLLARVDPAAGGDTMFANQYARVRDALRRPAGHARLAAAVHYGTELAKQAGVAQEAVTHAHPVVRTHPETGRNAASSSTATTRATSRAGPRPRARRCSQYLYAQASRPEYTWRHHWQVGDLLIWDNRCTQHA